MYKTGHSLIKARMKEIGSPFAGEMSGHFFFGERWYGVDDGIYAAARLLEILAGTEAPPEAILNSLPTSYSTPELKVEMQEGENHAFIDALQAQARFEDARVTTIDGVRADFADGWGLVRASNTTPILVVRFDGETEAALTRIKHVFRAKMLAINPDLELPF
jgi:phosphomannomutase/phosphoglucomutase